MAEPIHDPTIDPETRFLLELSQARDAAALVVIDSNAFKVATDLEAGEFELQVHRTHPEAPLSPVYLNLRPQGVKGGTLTNSNFGYIGSALVHFARSIGLPYEPRYVSGIPSAGEPFLEHMLIQDPKATARLSPMTLQKTVDGSQTRIVPPPKMSWPKPEKLQNVLLVDDLVTKAGTKKQAVEAVAAMGGKVTDLLVFVDRSGGRAGEELASLGVRLHAVWEFDALLEFWYAKGRLGSRHHFEALSAAVSAYPDKLAPFLAS